MINIINRARHRQYNSHIEFQEAGTKRAEDRREERGGGREREETDVNTALQAELEVS